MTASAALLTALTIAATASCPAIVVAFSTPVATRPAAALPSCTSYEYETGTTSSWCTSRNNGSLSALFMAKGATNNKQQSGGKKRRFLQQAHPIPAPEPPTATQQTVIAPKAGGNGDLGGLAGGAFAGGKSSSTKSTATKTPPPASSSSTSKSKRRGPPLQTSKSIEELEAILERRHGTASTTMGQKEGDADFTMSFGADDDDHDDSTKSKGKRKKEKKIVGSNGLKGAAVFRANRVMDPWAEEEGLYKDEATTKAEEKEVVEEKPKQNKKQRYDRNEAMLNRVRSNQERLQPKQNNNGKKETMRGSTDTFNVPVDVSKDYYDEDDEGYENNDGSRKNSPIAPRPAGGMGSFLKKSAAAPVSTSSLTGGIFSDQSMYAPRDVGDETRKERRAREREEAEAEANKPARPKRKERRFKALLDDDGKEMLLSLEQAEKRIKSILSEDDGVEGDGSSSSISSWEDVGITEATLLSNLQSSQMACPNPLPVQDKACPPIVAMNDVLISTHTGSGKTLAFLAPIAQSLLMSDAAAGANNSSPHPRAVVIAPGRELASQIVSVAQTLFQGTGLKVVLAIGGTPYNRNVENLRKKKPDLVVGTPGRIAELIIGRPGEKSGKLKISNLQFAVLDEFDALLQYPSHKEPTMAVMDTLDRQHGNGGNLQKVLCSATALDMMQQKDVKGGVAGIGEKDNIIEQYLRPGYAHASVDDSDLLVTSGKSKAGARTTSARVSRTTIHGALHVPHQRLALEAVRKILNTNPQPQQVLIFVDSPRRVDIVIEKLAKMDIIAAPLHGGATTKKSDRAQVNKALREGYVGIVVATEMAARGIDAPYLTHVINLDLPTDSSHYAHRAGRCGRGGRPGVAVSITCDKREKGVPHRFADELGIEMFNIEARESKLRIVEG